MSTILLTGAGGAAIPDLIRHLKELGHRVLTCDMDPQAPGLFLGDGGYVVPPADNFKVWYPAMCDLITDQDIEAFVPLVDEELENAKLLGYFPLPSQQAIVPVQTFCVMCLDKWELMRGLHAEGIPVPATILHAFRDSKPILPIVAKPRRGRGSRDVALIFDEADWALWSIDHLWDKTYILQEYIDGPEYTVSVVCDQANVVHAVVPKRIIRKEGSTRLAVTERNAKIDTLCRRIADAFTPCGPFNVQLRLRDGEPYVFEINPRFSGTVNLTIAAGCDEVGGLIELAMGRPYIFGEWREGIVLVRQTHDGIMTLGEFEGKIPRRWDDGVGTSGR